MSDPGVTSSVWLLPVPDLDFDSDLAIITPVPDSDFDKDLEEHAFDPEGVATLLPDAEHDKDLEQAATPEARVGPQWFRISDDVSSYRLSGASNATRKSYGNRKPLQLSERAQSFIEWCVWRRPFLRFEGKSKGLAWDYPLAKSEKRELLLLVMLGAERDMQVGSHDEVRNVIQTATAAQVEVGAKLKCMASVSRPSMEGKIEVDLHG